MLLIKILSAVEASEKHAIENAWLVKWRDTLKEAAAEGDEVLASFRQRQQRAMDAAHQGPGDDADQQEQEQEQPSSSSSNTASAATTTGNTVPSGSGMVQCIRNATKTVLFSSDEDMGRLNSAVERLEELSPEIRVFIKLLKLEILTPEQITAENRGEPISRARGPRAAPGGRRDSPTFGPHGLETLMPDQRSTENTQSVRVAKRKKPSASGGYGSNINLFGGPALGALLPAPPSMNKEESAEESCGETPTDQVAEATQEEEEDERSKLVDRLEEAFAAICRAVELADGRDLRDHEWLT
ncbi:hypothetical protein BAE44_0013821 [Dichanthelium oligosanthes]|uniref:Rx N-terminal domain-containing protein n=1 Tax=Dichanthelium oligosanthes TaxID=888268 RepID=A0A1E5VJ56_9POAL|nr:hypothetical protein BAE44_0013821 [Dichanthelium oligosanthes]